VPSEGSSSCPRRRGASRLATLERDAARRVFARLGATADVSALGEADGPTASDTHGLSPRERQVLRLVAGGLTNKAIARELGLSERTSTVT